MPPTGASITDFPVMVEHAAHQFCLCQEYQRRKSSLRARLSQGNGAGCHIACHACTLCTPLLTGFCPHVRRHALARRRCGRWSGRHSSINGSSGRKPSDPSLPLGCAVLPRAAGRALRRCRSLGGSLVIPPLHVSGPLFIRERLPPLAQLSDPTARLSSPRGYGQRSLC